MRRITWFTLGAVAGVTLSKRGAKYWDAMKADPIGTLDHWVRLGRRLADTARSRVLASTHATPIED